MTLLPSIKQLLFLPTANGRIYIIFYKALRACHSHIKISKPVAFNHLRVEFLTTVGEQQKFFNTL